MLIVVIAGGEDQKGFQDKELPEGIQVQFVTTIDEVKPGAEGYFYLLDETDLVNDRERIAALGSPVFIKPVALDFDQLAPNCVKLGQWPALLFKETIEVEHNEAMTDTVSTVLNNLGWSFKRRQF